jgi:2',3'-cyclic-nucleotide 2'-phosphodiesterase (5'-nucleotidase family)
MNRPNLLILLFLIALTLGSCSSRPRMRSVEPGVIEMNSSVPTDSAAYNLLHPYKEAIDQIMNEQLAETSAALTKEQPESTLGNFVADAVLEMTNERCKTLGLQSADICLLNNGGLRAQLPKGSVTRRNAFELMPFENKIMIVTLSGEQTKNLFEYIAAVNGAPFSGATLKAKGKKVSAIRIAGADFDQTKTYRVATSDYLAAGGDKYDFFRSPVSADTMKYLLRDAIIDKLKKEKTAGRIIEGKKDGRIIYE